MMPRCPDIRHIPILLAALILGACLVAGAGCTRETRRPVQRKDFYGYRLPVGAVSRLGSDRLCKPNQWVNVAFVADGQAVAASYGTITSSSGDDLGITVWDRETGESICTLPGSLVLARSPSGKYIATVDMATHTVVVYDMPSGQRALRIDGSYQHDGGMRFFDDHTLALSPREATDTIERWNVQTGERLPPVRRQGLSGIWATDMGRYVVVRPANTWQLSVRDILLETEVFGADIYRRSGGEVLLRRAAVSSDGKVMACLAGETPQVFWWSADHLRDNQNGIPCLPANILALCTDGSIIAAAGGNAVCLYSVQQRRLTRVIVTGQQDVRSMDISPDGRTVVTAQDDGSVRLWDTSTGDEVMGPKGPGHIPWVFRFAQDGQKVFADYSLDAWEKTTWTWDTTTGQVLTATPPYQGPRWFSQDGRLTCVPRPEGCGTPEFAVLDAAGAELCSLRQEGGAVHDVVFSPDGALVAVESLRDISVFDQHSGSPLASVPLDRDKWSDWRRPVFTADGKTLIIIHNQREVGEFAAYDARSGAPVPILAQLKRWPKSGRLSADGKTVGGIAENGPYANHKAIGRWDAQTGRLLLSVRLRHDVSSVAMSPDGHWAVASYNHAPHHCSVWDAHTGFELLRPMGHSGQVLSVEMSPNGEWFATSSRDSTILVWSLAPKFWVDMIYGAKTPDMTTLWNDLGAQDMDKSFGAMCAFTLKGKRAVHFLHERLAALAEDQARLLALIADLDGGDWSVQERAAQELRSLGVRARATLGHATRNASPRARLIAAMVQNSIPECDDLVQCLPDEQRRRIRAIVALDHINTRDSRAVLEGVVRLAGLTLEAQYAESALKAAGTPQHTAPFTR
jgi:WD40 repeat protein